MGASGDSDKDVRDEDEHRPKEFQEQISKVHRLLHESEATGSDELSARRAASSRAELIEFITSDEGLRLAQEIGLIQTELPVA